MAKKNIQKSKKITRKGLIIAFVALLVLLIITSFYLLREGGIIKNTKNIEEKNFTIQDKCSIIVGKIVHPLDREDECINSCLAQCEIYGLRYDKVEFELKKDTCNTCNCFCD